MGAHEVVHFSLTRVENTLSMASDVFSPCIAVGTVLKVAMGYTSGTAVPVVSEEIKVVNVFSILRL